MRLKKETVSTVGAIWMWIVAAAITLSFSGEGTMLNTIRYIFMDRIGWTYYLVPPLLVATSLLFFNIKSDIAKPHVPWGLSLAIVALMGLTEAGSLGSGVSDRMVVALSFLGTKLVFVAIFLIGIIIMFNTSLDRFVDFILVRIQEMVGPRQGQPMKLGKDGKPVPLGKVDLKIKGTSQEVAKAGVPAKQGDTKLEIKQPAQLKADKDFKIASPMTSAPGDQGAPWEGPPITLLSDGPGHKADRGDMRANAAIIENTLDSFGIKAKVTEVNPGPAITQYAIKPPLGTKVSKITSLSSDLALALAAPTGQVRIEAPIPGRELVGIELPNRGLEFVTLKNMLMSPQMKGHKSKLAVTLGLDVSGNAMIADIAKMPHVLVAGTTGSGKSVLINSWICSLLYRTSPKDVRLILVDPKRVELTGYNGVPHLLTPVIVEPDKILSALRWAIKEMMDRYKKFAEVGVRNIDGFNELSGFQAMPYIVILIDELADLMAYAPVEVEDAICRLAQMARATGIHLVLATQRPSVDVITGLIKANIPARIAFNVSSMIDSRVIIDMPGAEKLLGKGDMLFVPPDQAKPQRIQGTFVSDREVAKVVEFLRQKNAEVQYTDEVLTQPTTTKKGGGMAGGGDAKDPLFEDAIRLICQHDKASSSLLQRRLSIGYARAARVIDQLEAAGIIGPGEGAKPRDVLIKNADEYFAQQAGGDAAREQ